MTLFEKRLKILRYTIYNRNHLMINSFIMIECYFFEYNLYYVPLSEQRVKTDLTPLLNNIDLL